MKVVSKIGKMTESCRWNESINQKHLSIFHMKTKKET